MSIRSLKKRRGVYLPHWTEKDGIYFVTFRLADSVPSSKKNNLEEEHNDIIQLTKYLGRHVSEDEEARMGVLEEQMRHLQQKDKGMRWLERDDIANVVSDALTHFDKERYTLFAWCVMPTHVHVVLQTITPCLLANIIHSWKSFSAKKANAILDRSGPFWLSEYYDHLIRNEDDFLRCITYVWDNPEKAGLHPWKWKWKADNFPTKASWLCA